MKTDFQSVVTPAIEKFVTEKLQGLNVGSECMTKVAHAAVQSALSNGGGVEGLVRGIVAGHAADPRAQL